MKLLKRKILFTLASEVDFFSPRVELDYHPYAFLYWRLQNYQTSSIRDAILQLVQSGEVDKIVRNRMPLFRLTARGRERLLSFFPLSLGQKKVWDRIWRIAIISSFSKSPKFPQSPQSSRKLRATLRGLSFKKLSRGVYITPLPISNQIKSLFLEENFSANIAVIESRRLLLGDDQQLAKQIWSLDSLLEQYQKLIIQAKTLLSQLRKQNRLTQQVKKQFFLILNFYFTLLEKDPGLPKKLLSDDWPASLAKEMFLRLVQEFKTKET